MQCGRHDTLDRAARPARRADASLPAAAAPIAPIRWRSRRATTNSTPRLGARVRAKRPRSACCRCICRAASRRRGAISSRSPARRAMPGSTPTSSPRRSASTRQTLAALADAGLDHVQISIQDSERASADRIAGYEGAFAQQARAGARGDAAGPAAHGQRRRAPRQYRPHRRDDRSARSNWARSRIEIAHVQYYGWALKNRAALMPTARAGRARGRQGRSSCARNIRGASSSTRSCRTITRAFPKPCMGGWGRRSLNVTPSGRVLPCHAARDHPRPRVLVGARPFACGDLAALARIQGVPRHGLDAGAMHELHPRETRFRRLPLPGLCADRRCARDRSRVSSRRRSRPRRAACRGQPNSRMCTGVSETDRRASRMTKPRCRTLPVSTKLSRICFLGRPPARMPNGSEARGAAAREGTMNALIFFARSAVF